MYLQAEHKGFILGSLGAASVYARALPLSMGPYLDTPHQLECKAPRDMTYCHNELWCRSIYDLMKAAVHLIRLTSYTANLSSLEAYIMQLQRTICAGFRDLGLPGLDRNLSIFRLNLDTGNHIVKCVEPCMVVCWLRVLQLAADHSYIISQV